MLCVDPTSPFSGGAILGDRIRMQAHAEDTGVFIRSMATRGHLGGLATTTAEASLVLDAAGYDVMIIETVGVGQDEVDIVRTADVSLVVLVPGTGDEVQALKAGIMEIADMFVVNKADREGADRTAASIEAMLTLEMWDDAEWRPPVMRTEATAGRGITELLEMVEKFRAHSGERVGMRRRARAEWRLRELLGRRFMQHLERDVLVAGEFDRTLDRIANRELDPYGAADALMARMSTLDHIGIAVEDSTAMSASCSRISLVCSPIRPKWSGPIVCASCKRAAPPSRARSAGSATIRRWRSFSRRWSRTASPLIPRWPTSNARWRGCTMCEGVPDSRCDAGPRQGAHGSRIAFIHPSSACGLLVEIKQPAAAHADTALRRSSEAGPA